jgi:hypothetical protein
LRVLTIIKWRFERFTVFNIIVICKSRWRQTRKKCALEGHVTRRVGSDVGRALPAQWTGGLIGSAMDGLVSSSLRIKSIPPPPRIVYMYVYIYCSLSTTSHYMPFCSHQSGEVNQETCIASNGVNTTVSFFLSLRRFDFFVRFVCVRTRLILEDFKFGEKCASVLDKCANYGRGRRRRNASAYETSSSQGMHIFLRY